jgi:hypothetical protein
MAKIKFDRNFYIPQGYELIAKNEQFGFEVWGIMTPRIVAMAFGGKRTKPDWHFRFNDQSRLQAKIEETLRGFMDWQDRKQKYKKERNKPHNVQIGDVFRCSWGYDQTNIDFYQVTQVKGSFVHIRPIAQMSEETLSMQGECVPMINEFIGDEMRKKVAMWNDEPSIKIYSFANAYRMKPLAMIGEKPVFASSHWTAYA